MPLKWTRPDPQSQNPPGTTSRHIRRFLLLRLVGFVVAILVIRLGVCVCVKQSQIDRDNWVIIVSARTSSTRDSGSRKRVGVGLLSLLNKKPRANHSLIRRIVNGAYDAVAEPAESVEGPCMRTSLELAHLDHYFLRAELDSEPGIVVIKISAQANKEDQVSAQPFQALTKKEKSCFGW